MMIFVEYQQLIQACPMVQYCPESQRHLEKEDIDWFASNHNQIFDREHSYYIHVHMLAMNRQKTIQ